MEYEYTKLESLRDAMEKRQKDKAGKLLEEMMLSSPAPRVGSGKVTGAAKSGEAVADKQRTSASPSDVGDYYSFLRAKDFDACVKSALDGKDPVSHFAKEVFGIDC